MLRRLIKILRPPFDLHAPVHVVGCELGPEDIEGTLATRTHRWRARNPCFCFIFRSASSFLKSAADTTCSRIAGFLSHVQISEVELESSLSSEGCRLRSRLIRLASGLSSHFVASTTRQ